MPRVYLQFVLWYVLIILTFLIKMCQYLNAAEYQIFLVFAFGMVRAFYGQLHLRRTEELTNFDWLVY